MTTKELASLVYNYLGRYASLSGQSAPCRCSGYVVTLFWAPTPAKTSRTGSSQPSSVLSRQSPYIGHGEEALDA